MPNPHFTKEQIGKASNISLFDYLSYQEPGCMKRSGPNEWCLKEHDSLKISNGKWHWFSRGIGGTNALSFLMKARGMRFPEAVEQLLGETVTPLARLPAKAKPPPSTALHLPKPHWNSGRAMAYLVNRRGIDREIADECVRRRILYETTAYGKTGDENHPCCVFVGQDGDGKAKYASLRSVEGGIKKDAPGSDKCHSFHLAAQTGGKTLIVCEGAIDALSIASLHKTLGFDWCKNHYVSLGGTSPLAAITYLQNRSDIRRVYFCLDNDQAGRTATERLRESIAQRFPDRGLSLEDRPPKLGKDYNEYLLKVKSRIKNERKLTQDVDARTDF